MKFSLLFFVYMLPWTSYGQTHEIEAIYYDQKGSPYMIERMYKNELDSFQVFINHSNENSCAIRNRTYLTNDTLILQQEHFLLLKPEKRIERFANSYKQMFASNTNGDTVRIYFYESNIHGQDSLIGDTTLINDNIKEFYNLSDALKNDRVTLILNGEINPNIGNSIANEVVKSYFVNGNIVRVEWIDSESEIYSFANIIYSKNNITNLSYTVNKDLIPELYRKDSIIWNCDTSVVKWMEQRIDWQKNYNNDYVFNDTSIQVWEGDSMLKETVFRTAPDFKYFLWNRIVNDDALVVIQLLNFQHIQQQALCFPNSGTVLTEFELDQLGRIVKQSHSRNGKTGRFVTYRYK